MIDLSGTKIKGNSLFSWLLVAILGASEFSQGAIQKTQIPLNLNDECEQVLAAGSEVFSPQAYAREAIGDVALAREEAPDPRFVDRGEEEKIVRKGMEFPAAFKEFVDKSGAGNIKLSALKTPSVNAENPLVVGRRHDETGTMLHAETQFKGVDTSTSLYVNKPVPTKPTRDSKYLIGKEHKFVVWHIHGGGTPSAEAMNASSKANHYVKHGIPLLAIDQPGHGKGTRYPFTSFDELVEYNLQMIEQLVDPDVKVIFTGHSWGGEFAMYLYMHYLNKPGVDPKWKERIAAILPESPPADMSLGGTPDERMELEEKLHKRLISDPELRAEVAPDDDEFNINVIRNEKSNPVALWMTTITHLGYRMLIPENVSELPPMLTIVGSADGLVYVGRSEFFDEMKKQLGEDRVVVMGPMETFKGKGLPTGHQIFDAQDEKGRPFVFTSQVDFVAQATGHDITRINHEGDNGFYSQLYRVYLLFGKNFAARKFFMDQVEFISVQTEFGENAIGNKKKGIRGEIQTLSSFFDRVKSVRDQNKKRKGIELQERITALGEKYRVSSGLREKALKEMTVDHSPERRAELEAYVQAAKALRDKYSNESDYSTDKEAQNALKEISEEKQKRLNDEVQKEIQRQKDAGVEIEIPSEDLLTVVQRIVELESARSSIKSANRKMDGKSDAEKNQILEDLKRQYNLETTNLDIIEADIEELSVVNLKLSETFKKARSKLLEQSKQIVKEAQKAFYRNISELGRKAVETELTKPEGISTIKDAEWELRLEPSENREQELKEFIEKLEALESEVNQEFNEQLKVALHELEKNELPEGRSSIADAIARLEMLNQIKDGEYVPEEAANREEIAQIVTEKLELEKRALEIKSKLTTSESQIQKLKKDRDRNLRIISALYDKSMIGNGDEKWPNETMPNWPNRIKEAVTLREEKLLAWKTTEMKLSEQKGRHLLAKLKERGYLLAEDIVNVPQDIQGLLKDYDSQREEYRGARNAVYKAFLVAVSLGELNGLGEEFRGADQVQGRLHELVGDSLEVFQARERRPAGDSIEGRLHALERQKEGLMGVASQIRRQLGENQVHYSQALSNSGSGVQPFALVQKISFKDLFSLEYSELKERFRDPALGPHLQHAFKDLMAGWTNVWSDVVQDDNFANPDWYPFEPFYHRLTP